ncbi:MAG: membrane protein insertion efficiency factor YidD [Patescibacteria group bacterium]
MTNIIIGLIRLYQNTLSPQTGLFRFIYLLPVFNLYGATRPGCKFQPTCSEYCVQTVREYGVVKGVWLTLRRIGRCV